MGMGDNKNAAHCHDAGKSNANSQDGIEDSTVNNNVLTLDKEEKNENAKNHSSFDEGDNAILILTKEVTKEEFLGALSCSSDSSKSCDGSHGGKSGKSYEDLYGVDPGDTGDDICEDPHGVDLGDVSGDIWEDPIVLILVMLVVIFVKIPMVLILVMLVDLVMTGKRGCNRH
eukprot:4054545-Ditylum_brightwellii.AAC.1